MLTDAHRWRVARFDWQADRSDVYARQGGQATARGTPLLLVVKVTRRESLSPKISRAKAHVRFSRYRAAQEAAPEGKLDLSD
jgi:hypothetical protein